MKTRAFLLLLVCFALVFAAVACKSKPASDASTGSTLTAAAPVTASSTNPCALITQEDVEKVLGPGATIKPGRVSSECNLDPADAIHGGLVLTLQPTRYWDSTKASLKAQDKNSKDYPGIGDDAYGLMGAIVAKKGNNTVQIGGMLNKTPMTQEEAVKFLATQALSRL